MNISEVGAVDRLSATIRRHNEQQKTKTFRSAQNGEGGLI